MAIDPPGRRGPITRDRFARESEAIRSQQVRGTWPILVNSGSTGSDVGFDLDGFLAETAETQIWVRIASAGTGSGGGLYGWVQVIGDGTPTGWVDVAGSPGGTVSHDPLVEANLYAGLPVGKRVPAWRERVTGRLVTQLELCP